VAKAPEVGPAGRNKRGAIVLQNRRLLPIKPLCGCFALSNPKKQNRDAVLRNREVPAGLPLKKGGGRPINPLNVVTGPPARRVK
jgi:hypothetical protein